MKPLYLIFILCVQLSSAQQGKIIENTPIGKKLSKIFKIHFKESGNDLLVLIENNTKDYYAISKIPKSTSQLITLPDGSTTKGVSVVMSFSEHHDQRILIPTLGDSNRNHLKFYTVENYKKLIKENKSKQITLVYGILMAKSGKYESFDIQLDIGNK